MTKRIAALYVAPRAAHAAPQGGGGNMHRYLRGDIFRDANGLERVAGSVIESPRAWLLRTAREEWDGAHGLTIRRRDSLAHEKFDVYCENDLPARNGTWIYEPHPWVCSVCGPRPAEPRSAEEIEAMRWRPTGEKPCD